VLSGKEARTATALTEIVRDTHADKAILIGIAGDLPTKKWRKAMWWLRKPSLPMTLANSCVEIYTPAGIRLAV